MYKLNRQEGRELRRDLITMLRFLEEAYQCARNSPLLLVACVDELLMFSQSVAALRAKLIDAQASADGFDDSPQRGARDSKQPGIKT